ncbi:hypothetical protein LLH06_01330 [Mucilaginibacter daejeonensis]|uniref:hypothetical protein n=1 Tax=Mucilaginibacter daejeonensis TaxID=398049 RepID=UPI001D17A85E|nr:hypothetical protein [Mucilaginibacter daejeonensis]UEG53614.1 hypothetical protein LLH06_01330 [Mucilaginibacter daejeonensis]
MKIFKLWLCTLFLALTVHAQSNYKPGYIIKANGDSIRGFINYREWNRSPLVIEFKSSAVDATPTTYGAAALQAFEVTGMDSYVTYRGPLSMDKTHFPDLPSGLDTTTRMDTVFLQVVYKGVPLSLLKHRDFKTRLFIKNKNELPTELKYYEYYGMDGRSVEKVGLYTNTLRSYCAQYQVADDKVMTNIERSQYDEDEIRKILKHINHDDRAVTASTFGKRFFVGVMANRITTEFNDQNDFVGIPGHTYLPRISGGMDFFLNKFVQRTYFRTELAVAMARPTIVKTVGSFNYSYKLGQSIISLSPQMFLNLYNAEKFKVHIGGGFGLNYLINSKNDLVVENASSKAVSTINNVYDYEKFVINFLFRAGVTLNKRVEISALYSPKASMTRYVNYSISNRSLGVGINYLFGK